MSNNTDFIDEDLTGRRDRNHMIDPIAARRAAESHLERMGKQRERLEDQVAGTVREIEKLRQKQEDLENERHSLEELRRQQDVYLRDKRDMAQRIHQSMVLLEKEEVHTSQLTELYADTREKFQAMQERVAGLEEGNWSDDAFEHELLRSLDHLKALRMEFNKAMARLDAFGWPPAGAEGETAEGPVTEYRPGFAYWMKVGIAVSIPLALFLGVSALLVYFALTDWLVK